MEGRVRGLVLNTSYLWLLETTELMRGLVEEATAPRLACEQKLGRSTNIFTYTH